MSKLKEEMMKIHKNTDFKVNFAGVTQIGEFIYTHGGSVRPGLEYHIHYTNDKEEVFMTGNTHNPSSKIIERVNGKTLFSTYSELISKTKKQYPKNYHLTFFTLSLMLYYYYKMKRDKCKALFYLCSNFSSCSNSWFKVLASRTRRNIPGLLFFGSVFLVLAPRSFLSI